jgi:alpha-1,3-rhamnosyltransferase
MVDSSAQPLVSVIISSYNHAAYVEASIESVLAQTYPRIELLVIDDGSVDDSAQRISRLQKAHGFTFLRQANQGLALTLNQALERGSGSLIAPFGSDDVMLPDRIAVQVAYMRGKPEVGICAGNIEYIDATGASLIKRNRARPFRRLDFAATFDTGAASPPAPTLLFRRSALEEVGGFDPAIPLEDLLVELKITRAGYFIDVLPEVLAKYRVHGANTYKNRRLMVEAVLATYARFSDHPAYPRVCTRFVNSMLLKCARDDKPLARELLGRLALRDWNSKTLRALGRLWFG